MREQRKEEPGFRLAENVIVFLVLIAAVASFIAGIFIHGRSSALYFERVALFLSGISFLACLGLTAVFAVVYRRVRKARMAAEDAGADTVLRLDATDYKEQNIQSGNAVTMMKQIMASLSDGVLAYRLPGREVLVINDEAKRIFGFEDNFSPELLNRYIAKNIMPDSREIIREASGKLKGARDEEGYTFRIRHEDGVILVVHAYTKLLEFADGSQFILSTVQDITEQARLETMFRQERGQYRDALINRCEYYYSVDLTEGLIYEEFTTARGINPIRELGFTVPVELDVFNEKWVREWQPQFLEEGMKQKIKSKFLLDTFGAGETISEVEYYIPQFDIYTRVDMLLSRNEENGHVLGFAVARDTTESRKEEQRREREMLDAKAALEDAYEAVSRASAAKTKFLSSMSHDIRTPMNAIVGMTAIAGTHLDDPERVADCLGKITVSSKHLLGLINEVLDMSKIESGKVDLSEEEFNLPDLIDNLLTMSKPQIEAKRHELTVLCSGIEHERVIGDSQRIQQSFMNLMSNAVKYTPDGGKIRLSLAEKQTNNPRVGCYEFIFEDNGIGMSAEFQKHVFEPFSRENDVRVKNIQGTGLGMAITNNIVKMMNGNIHIDSVEGRGTKVTVVIYLKLQDTDEAVCDESFIDLPVLVADDDQLACETACEMLAELGMKGEWVLSGKEAVELAVSRHGSQNAFFAVILDWKMPELDGIAATKEIRKKVGSEMPIIIISAYDWSDIELEARAAGANAFISKPLFKSRMSHLFRELLGNEPEKERAAALEPLISENFSGRRVLLVEDNELNSEIAGEVLEMAGLEVEFAKDGKQALDRMAEVSDGYYDMIFMDIQMPVLSGYEATRAIRSLPGDYVRRVPIIAMTANAFAQDVQEALGAGMNEHITKPLDFKQLAKVLRKWMPETAEA